MKFRTPIKIEPNKGFVNHRHKMISIGSCFASNTGAHLSVRKFNISQVQFGIQFNPISIERNIRDAMNNIVDEKLILERDEHFYHYNYSANFYAKEKEVLVNFLRNIQIDFNEGFEYCDRLFLTFGTAWTYRHKELNSIVSNCHKIPQKEFTKELLDLDELKKLYLDLFNDLKAKNPKLEIVLTVSPVRHVKNGLHENNISKSILLLLTDFLSKSFDFVHYFPAYEIVMDDLRDYRFYGSDLIHPNDQAIDYVFECFQEAYFSGRTQEIADLAIKRLQFMGHTERAPSQAQIKAKRLKLEAMDEEIDRLKGKL